mgnify:CR=1 FL=1
MNDTATSGPVAGVEHWTQQGRGAAVPVGEIRRLGGGKAGGAVRPRLVDGLATDLRPRRSRASRLLGHGLVRAARLRLLDASTWKATAAPTRRATSTATSPTAPTTWKRRPSTSSARAAREGHGVRNFFRRAAGGAVRAASSRARGAPRARRLRLDGRRRAHADRAAQEAARSSSPASAVRSTARSCVRSFARDHPECAERAWSRRFADAILALDDSMPNGTYIDMCSKLPIVDPAKITMPTLVMRGQYDGIAAFDDVLEFFQPVAPSGQAILGHGRQSRTRASSRRITGRSTTSCIAYFLAARPGIRRRCGIRGL